MDLVLRSCAAARGSAIWSTPAALSAAGAIQSIAAVLWGFALPNNSAAWPELRWVLEISERSAEAKRKNYRPAPGRAARSGRPNNPVSLPSGKP